MKNKFVAVVMASMTLAASAFAQTGTLAASGSAASADAAIARMDPSAQQEVFPLVAFMAGLLAAEYYHHHYGDAAVAAASVPADSVEPLFDR